MSNFSKKKIPRNLSIPMTKVSLKFVYLGILPWKTIFQVPAGLITKSHLLPGRSLLHGFWKFKINPLDHRYFRHYPGHGPKKWLANKTSTHHYSYSTTNIKKVGKVSETKNKGKKATKILKKKMTFCSDKILTINTIENSSTTRGLPKRKQINRRETTH